MAETEKAKAADALAEQPAPATADELAATEHHGHADEELAASLTNADGYTLSTAKTTIAVTTENCFEPETVIADTLLTETGSLDNTQTETVLAESQGKGAGKRAAQNEEEAAAIDPLADGMKNLGAAVAPSCTSSYLAFLAGLQAVFSS